MEQVQRVLPLLLLIGQKAPLTFLADEWLALRSRPQTLKSAAVLIIRASILAVASVPLGRAAALAIGKRMEMAKCTGGHAVRNVQTVLM
jgi:hypothetical protein